MTGKRWNPAPEYPCKVQTCPALVALPSMACSVHKTWNEGPHDHECIKCRRPIERGEHWRLLDGDGTRPVHSQCVAGKARGARVKKGPGLFDTVTP